METKGYSKKELFILAFDHRTSFTKNLLGIIDRSLTPDGKGQIVKYKKVIFEGFKKAVEEGVSKEVAGILVDEEFGADVAREAKAEGYILAMPLEKSGQEEFDFEYGNSFREHIESFDPNYVKVLVRYNPEADREANKRQTQRLKVLSDYLHESSRLFLFELLVSPTPRQIVELDGSREKYDSELRPQLMVAAMRELQQASIEPSVWKLEGVQKTVDARALVRQARDGGREASVITLGRGEGMEKVQGWLRTGAETSGVIGFQVGRTIFWEPLVALKNAEVSREAAIEKIAGDYFELVDLWQSWRKKSFSPLVERSV